MTNSVDEWQTVNSVYPAAQAYMYLSENLGSLWYIFFFIYSTEQTY